MPDAEQTKVNEDDYTIEARWLAQQLGVGAYDVKKRRDRLLDEGPDWIRKKNIVTLTRSAAEKIAESYQETLEALSGSKVDSGGEQQAGAQGRRLAIVISKTQNLSNRRILKVELAEPGAERPPGRSINRTEFPGSGEEVSCRVRDVKMFVKDMMIPVMMDNDDLMWRLACRNPRVRGRINFTI